MIYKVWEPSNTSSEFAEEILADTPEEAAEAYAESDYDNGNFEGGEYELKVMDPDGDVFDVDVVVDFYPSFYGYVQG